MNYKIKATEENRLAIKDIADRNIMNEKYKWRFESCDLYYFIDKGQFVFYPEESEKSKYQELTFDQFKEMFDKVEKTNKMSELENWLKATKEKNLSLDELASEISLLPTEQYNKLKWQSNCNPEGKASILFNQFQKEKEFSPKRGDRVLVWGDNKERSYNRIFVAEVKGAIFPYVTVHEKNEIDFTDNLPFTTEYWSHMKPLPTEQPTKNKVEQAAYQDCKKSGFNNTSYAANCIQSFINGAKWQSEQPKETDFKSQVIELIKKRIGELNSNKERAIKNENYTGLRQLQFAESELEFIVKIVKEQLC